MPPISNKFSPILGHVSFKSHHFYAYLKSPSSSWCFKLTFMAESISYMLRITYLAKRIGMKSSGRYCSGLSSLKRLNKLSWKIAVGLVVKRNRIKPQLLFKKLINLKNNTFLLTNLFLDLVKSVWINKMSRSKINKKKDIESRVNL